MIGKGSVTCGLIVEALAQAKKPAAAKKMGGKGGGAIKRAQAIVGLGLLLCSPAGSHITGQSIGGDGGISAR